MNCPSCQTVNAENARFCSGCGTRLTIVCPNCSAAAAPDARFCSKCGQRLGGESAPTASSGESPAAPAPVPQTGAVPAAPTPPAGGRGESGERRLVTVLFCDVQGSTALAEQLDPEEWTEIMNGVYVYLTAPVNRYEGLVARLMGDAILAFFGAPTAHEDDPRRAILAGLEIVEGIKGYRAEVKRRWGLEFNVRVGINTGLVVVGNVGSDIRLEYTAMGDAVNLAARMEQTATAGTVQVTANTQRQVAELFEFEALEPIEVKGKSEPVQAFRALRARAGSVPTRGIEGLRSPLVGRERERQALEQAISDLTQGRGNLISVTGEAGLGKSRLVAEVRSSLASALQDEGSLLWLEGRSFSYQTAIPYTPFVDLLGKLLDLPSESADSERYAHLRARLASLAPNSAASIGPFLATLFGIHDLGEAAERIEYLSPPQLRAGVTQAVCALLRELCAHQPVLLVFEDLHWADSTSLDLLDEIMKLVYETRLGVLALFRPQREEPSWRFHERAAREFAERYTHIALERLGDQDSRSLVANLLEIEDLPERVRTLILQKTEGNPFYVEEVIRSLLDARLVVREDGHWRATREIEHIAVPDTLAGVITARLDKLDEPPKRLLQAASVFGREFQRIGIDDVYGRSPEVPTSLVDLQRRELIRERNSFPLQVYAFKHVLIQETVYGSILLSRRRDLHRRVAECIERTEPDRIDQIAHHFLQARDEARALPYVLAAADRAARAYASTEALHWYQRALDILGDSPDVALARRAYEGLGKALELTGNNEQAVDIYRRMRQVGAALGDAPMQVSALNKEAFVLALGMGQFGAVDPLLTEAERLAREHDDQLGLIEHATIRCGACVPVANFDGALGYLGESVEIARDAGLDELLTLTLGHRATTLTFMARYTEAEATAHESLRVAQSLGNLEHVAEAQVLPLPMALLARGELARAREMAEEGIALAGRIGAMFYEGEGHVPLVIIQHLQGDFEAVIAACKRGLELADLLGPMGMLFAPSLLGELCLVYQSIGEEAYERAFAPLKPRLEAMEQYGGASALASLALRALATGDLDRAENLFQRGLTEPTATWLIERPRLLLGAAHVALARGDVDQAATRITETEAVILTQGARHVEPMIAMARAQLALALKDPLAAQFLLRRAADQARDFGMHLVAWQGLTALTQATATSARVEEAEAVQREATAAGESLAARIADPALREAFLSRVHATAPNTAR